MEMKFNDTMTYCEYWRKLKQSKFTKFVNGIDNAFVKLLFGFRGSPQKNLVFGNIISHSNLNFHKYTDLFSVKTRWE
jgi:hypothetical protein